MKPPRTAAPAPAVPHDPDAWVYPVSGGSWTLDPATGQLERASAAPAGLPPETPVEDPVQPPLKEA